MMNENREISNGDDEGTPFGKGIPTFSRPIEDDEDDKRKEDTKGNNEEDEDDD